MTIHSPYASVGATRNIMQRYGLDTKKALGQHFLINDGVVGKICDLSQLASDDVVFEIGPGIGTLTYALLSGARAVVSVERDRDMIEILKETCSDFKDSFALINADALKVKPEDLSLALAKLPALHSINVNDAGMAFSKQTPEAQSTIAQAPKTQSSNIQASQTQSSNIQASQTQSLLMDKPHYFALPGKLIANLPYAVAATLVLEVFQKLDSIQSATVMVQGEVADRMCAKPGSKDYGAYTIKLALYARPAGRFAVKPQNFFPPPRVDSAVLRLERTVLSDENGQIVQKEVLNATSIMADAAFANRRKTLLNSCKNFFAPWGEKGDAIIAELPQILVDLGIDGRRRGEALSLAEFLKLGKAFVSFL